MVGVVVRAFSTVVEVIIAVAVASLLGDTTAGKIWAAVLIAAVIGVIEWFLIWAPKHFALARKLLDPRSAHVGVWAQKVTKTAGDKGRPITDEPNRLGFYWVDFDQGIYQISGFAYNIEGNKYAQWRSQGSPEFTSDGHSMTYRFVGEIIGADDTLDDIERTGITRVDIENRTGRVDHVGERRIILFDLEEVTPELLDELDLGDLEPGDIKDPSKRDRVAAAYVGGLQTQRNI